MDNLNLITSDFTFSGNFDGCLPQKVGVSAPVLKRNDPVGTVHGGKNGGIGCIAGQKRTDFSSALPVLVKLFGNTLFGNHALYRNSIGVI